MMYFTQKLNSSMLALKKTIFNEIKNNHAKSANYSDEQLDDLIFHHRTGLRLSYSGFIILKNIFTVYSFEIPPNIKTKHRFGMSKMEYPYFFTRSRLILFSEMDAMTVKLSGGIEQFLENCSTF